jgi:hypothetical protein
MATKIGRVPSVAEDQRADFVLSRHSRAGKTILTSIVLGDLYARFQSEGSISIAYMYCEFQQEHKQKPEDLLSSLSKLWASVMENGQ